MQAVARVYSSCSSDRTCVVPCGGRWAEHGWQAATLRQAPRPLALAMLATCYVICRTAWVLLAASCRLLCPNTLHQMP